MRTSETDRKKPDIGALFEHPTAIDEALRQATREALRLHKKLGNPVVVWRDGQIVWLRPEEIPVDDEP